MCLFSYPLVLACVSAAQKNRFNVLSTHNICFGPEIRRSSISLLSPLV